MAAAILTAGLLFCVAYAANEEFRVNVLNFFLEIRENGTQFFFRSDETGAVGTGLSQVSSAEKDFPFEFTYIPEGYNLCKKIELDEGATGTSYFCSYTDSNDNPNNFNFEIGPLSTGTGLFIDTENAAVTDVNIRGYKGMMIQKKHALSDKGCVMYLWFDLENQRMFFLIVLAFQTRKPKKSLTEL